MDYADINSRLERIHISIGKKYEDDVLGHMQTKNFTDGEKSTLSISFDAKHDENETVDRISNIISNLANLKDHLKIKLETAGGNPQDIEDEINQRPSLQIVIDLHNQEKHGYPLKKERSGKSPKITEVSKALSTKPGVERSGFTFNPFTGAAVTNNMAVVIIGKIVDKEGNLLYHFSDLVESSVKDWEMIIKKYNLGTS